MALAKRAVMLAAGVAVGLLILNYATKSFAPSLRSYLGMSA